MTAPMNRCNAIRAFARFLQRYAAEAGVFGRLVATLVWRRTPPATLTPMSRCYAGAGCKLNRINDEATKLIPLYFSSGRSRATQHICQSDSCSILYGRFFSLKKLLNSEAFPANATAGTLDAGPPRLTLLRSNRLHSCSLSAS